MPTDVRLKQTFDPAGVTMDFFLKPDGTLDESEELATAVRVALGTDALVGPEDILPDPDSTDRRGWWGDMDAEVVWDGWPIGCKNWLLTRAKITDQFAEEGDTLERARLYTLSALQPMLDRRVASQMSVVAERTELERIEVHATMYRGPKYEIDLQYQLLWEEPEEPTLLLPGPAPLAMWPGERQVHLICYVPSVAGPREYFPIAQNLFYSMTAPTVLTTAPAVPAVAAMALATAAPGRLIGPYLSPAARILTLTGSISAPRMQPPPASLGLASDIPTAFVLPSGLTMPTLVVSSPQFTSG